MSEYDSYSGGYSTSNVFERLAVSETHSSARKRNTSRKGYGGGASSVSSRSFSVSRSRPSTPASLYETPSFNSSSSSRKVNPAIFDRLANTETYATATMKGKVPERGRSKSTSKRTSNAFFERMAYTETFASAQMKGLIDTDDAASKSSYGNAGRPVSRSRSVKSTRSAKSTRSSTSRGRGGESFFDRMANTDTYASAQLKGKYNFEKTTTPRHTPTSRYKPSPRSTPKNRMSIFERLSSTQTLSSAGKNRKTPDPARSYRNLHSQNYPQSGSSLRNSSTRSYGSSYSPHHKFSSTASVGSTRSNFTARSQRSAASARSAYTAPSTRTARTAASTARSSSSSRGMSSSFSSSYHSHSNTTDYVKPVARYAKPAPVTQVPIHSRRIPVLATSPTPEKIYGKTVRRPPTPESSFGKRTSSNGSSRRSVREPAVNPPSPMSASMSKSYTSTRSIESKPAIRGLSSVSKPITTTIPKKAPEVEPKPPTPPPRPVLQFESDDELSFGDDSEEDEDFLAAPSVSSAKAAPQDAGSAVISETKDGNNTRAVVSEDSMPENKFNELSSKAEEPVTITKDRGFDSREEFVLDPESEEEGAVEATTSAVLDESDEDGSYHMDNEDPESGSEKSEKSEEKIQQDDEPIVAATSTQEAAEESDDGLSIGSGESEDEDWLTGGGTATKSEDASEPVEPSHSALEEEEEDELGDLLDSEAESAELSAEEPPSRANSVESVDPVEISEQVTDDAQDVGTFDDEEEDEEVDADPNDFPDDLDEDEAEDQDYYNEEIDQLDSLDLVLDATGDEYDVSVNGDEDEVLEEIGEKSEENDEEEKYVAESMEDEDYLSEDDISAGNDNELDDVLEEAHIKPEESTVEEDYVPGSMDDEEYMSEGEDEVDVDPAEEVRDMVEEEPAEEVLDGPTYTIVKSEKYHPQFGFEPVNPDEIFLTETLVAFENGEISNQEIAVLLIEALFEKNFENGDHWEIDAGTARELEEDEGGGGDLEGRAFVVKRQARLDWNDLYSVAAAKGNIIISPEKKEIRVENYSYFVAG